MTTLRERRHQHAVNLLNRMIAKRDAAIESLVKTKCTAINAKKSGASDGSGTPPTTVGFPIN